MSEILSGEELAALVQRVFRPQASERLLAVIVDLPDAKVADNPQWRQRRAMAAGWVEALRALEKTTGLEARLVLYRNAHANNADLPEKAWLHAGGPLPETAEQLESAPSRPFAEVLREHPLVLAPTEFSATAPLKLMGKQLGFRGATMPGFSPEMIPALRLDYGEINRRVERLKGLLDEATAAHFEFEAEGVERRLTLDLRHRSAHASGGLLPTPGQAGNLPSGEAYIVPYEGERTDDPTRSEGELPVQFGEEVVVYAIRRNRAVGILDGAGATAAQEAKRLAAEPAYGNMAELGLGVLGDFGVQPCGEVLLDEKLGLHIAFGRSDHFGGQVGAKQFSSPEAVVHIDRVYIPQLQPKVCVRRVVLTMPDGGPLELMRDGKYMIAF